MQHSNAFHNRPQTVTDLFLKISNSMLLASDQSSFLKETLEDVGHILHVHRVYIFNFDGKNWNSTFSWAHPSMPPFEDLLGGQTLEDVMHKDGFLETLNAGNSYIISCPEDFDDPAAREILKKYNIFGLIITPLFSKGELIGFLGVDQCEYVENWVGKTLDTMITLAQLYNNGINHFNALKLLENKDREAQYLLDIFPFPIYITDPKTHTIVRYNKSIAEYFDTKNVATEKCYKVLHNFDKPCDFCSTVYLSLEGEPHIWDMHNDYIDKDFKIIDCCIAWDDLEKARLSIFLDISDSLRMQREQVLDRESSVAKSRFLANMSHELRTPLNGIIGMTHLAIKNNTDTKISNYLHKIKESSRNLLDIINDILDFSKMEAGKLELDQHPFNPTALFAETKELLADHAQGKNFCVNYHVADTMPPLLVGDSLRFSQIMIHLVRNAFKFTEKGCVNIGLAVDDMVEDGATKILILTVEDSGIGMSEKALEQLFIEFSQADSSNTRRHGGTGLGLAIVSNLLTLMNGTIAVESTLQKGTLFTCRIPFLLPEHADLTAETMLSMEEKSLTVNLEGIRVLLAEDNEINSIIAYEMLTQMGCIVDCACHGEEVLDFLERKEYDIVLMDVQMPIMDGLEATRHVRQDVRFNTLPIVALTAHILKEEINKCYDVGMQSHVLKPISAKALHNVIATYTQTPFNFEAK